MSDAEDFRQRFQQRMRIAEQRLQEDEMQASAHSRHDPESGDLYVFSGEFPPGLQWGVIGPHPQDASILFTVPADDTPWLGTSDLATQHGLPTAPLILRCGCGLWLPKNRFPAGIRVAQLSEQDRRRARGLLAQLVRGEISATSLQHETDIDPEYEAWIQRVSWAVERLRKATDSGWAVGGSVMIERRVIPGEKFQRRWPTQIANLPDIGREFALAAAPGGVLGNVLHELGALPAPPPPQCRIDLEGGKGEMYVLAEPTGARLMFLPFEQELPPAMQILDEERAVATSIEWRRSPRGMVYAGFPVAPWRESETRMVACIQQPDGTAWSIEWPEGLD